MYLEKFSARLKELMELEGVSNRALAIKIKADRKGVRLWLSGKYFPRYDFLIALGDYFKVSIDYLVGLEDMPGGFARDMRDKGELAGLRRQLSDVMRGYMEKHGLSKYQMGKLLFVDVKSVKGILDEYSIPETGTLIKISQLTKVTMNELLRCG